MSRKCRSGTYYAPAVAGSTRHSQPARSRGEGKHVCCEVEFNATAYTHIFGSPQLSGKQLGAPFPFLRAWAVEFGWRCLLLGRKGGLKVPNGKLDLVAPVGECSIVGREAPFAQTHGQDCSPRRLYVWLAQRREPERAVRSA